MQNFRDFVELQTRVQLLEAEFRDLKKQTGDRLAKMDKNMQRFERQIMAHHGDVEDHVAKYSALAEVLKGDVKGLDKRLRDLSARQDAQRGSTVQVDTYSSQRRRQLDPVAARGNTPVTPVKADSAKQSTDVLSKSVKSTSTPAKQRIQERKKAIKEVQQTAAAAEVAENRESGTLRIKSDAKAVAKDVSQSDRSNLPLKSPQKETHNMLFGAAGNRGKSYRGGRTARKKKVKKVELPAPIFTNVGDVLTKFANAPVEDIFKGYETVLQSIFRFYAYSAASASERDWVSWDSNDFRLFCSDAHVTDFLLPSKPDSLFSSIRAIARKRDEEQKARKDESATDQSELSDVAGNYMAYLDTIGSTPKLPKKDSPERYRLTYRKFLIGLELISHVVYRRFRPPTETSVFEAELEEDASLMPVSPPPPPPFAAFPGARPHAAKKAGLDRDRITGAESVCVLLQHFVLPYARRHMTKIEVDVKDASYAVAEEHANDIAEIFDYFAPEKRPTVPERFMHLSDFMACIRRLDLGAGLSKIDAREIALVNARNRFHDDTPGLDISDFTRALVVAADTIYIKREDRLKYPSQAARVRKLFSKLIFSFDQLRSKERLFSEHTYIR